MHEPISLVTIVKKGVIVTHSKQATYVKIDSFYEVEEEVPKYLPITNAFIARLAEKETKLDISNYIHKAARGDLQLVN